MGLTRMWVTLIGLALVFGCGETVDLGPSATGSLTATPAMPTRMPAPAEKKGALAEQPGRDRPVQTANGEWVETAYGLPLVIEIEAPEPPPEIVKPTPDTNKQSADPGRTDN